MTRITFFMQNLFPQMFLPDTFPPKVWDFSPEIPKKLNYFSTKPFFGKMLVWTGRMPLWWELRHFSPEYWKSSARFHNWWRKMILFRNFFPSKSSFGHIECSSSEPSELFDQKPENHQLKFRNWQEKFFLVGKLYSFKGFWNRRGHFRQPGP